MYSDFKCLYNISNRTEEAFNWFVVYSAENRVPLKSSHSASL